VVTVEAAGQTDFRYLGKDHVDARVLAAVGRGLTDQDRQHIRRDLPMAPAWIGDHLRTLALPGLGEHKSLTGVESCP